MRQAAELGLRRAGDHQRLHAGGLRGHHVHHHAGRVDGVAAGHVEPDPLDGHPALGDGRARAPASWWCRCGAGRRAPRGRARSRPRARRGRRGRVRPARASSSAAGTRTCAGRTPSNDSPYSRAASAPRSATASTIGRTFGTTASTSTPPRGSAARKPGSGQLAAAQVDAGHQRCRSIHAIYCPRAAQIVIAARQVPVRRSRRQVRRVSPTP